MREVPGVPRDEGAGAGRVQGSIPYYTFTSHEATEVLRSYLRQREERFGRIGPNEPLFSSDWTLWKRRERPMRRPAPQTINRILKSAARTAGITEWQHISAHCLEFVSLEGAR